MARPTPLNPADDGACVYNWTPGGINDANAGALNGAPPAYSKHTATTWADDIGGLNQFHTPSDQKFNLSSVLYPGIYSAPEPNTGVTGDLNNSLGTTMHFRGCTLLFAVANPIVTRKISDFPTGTSDLGTAPIFKSFYDVSGNEKLGVGVGLEARLQAATRHSGLVDVAANSTCCAHAGMEILVVQISAAGVLSHKTYRNGAFVTVSTAGAAISDAVMLYHFLAGTFGPGGGKTFTGIYTAQCCINAVRTDDILLRYCEYMALAYQASLAPTKGLILFGDSITQGYGCSGGISLAGLLGKRLRQTHLVFNAGIGLGTAANTNIPTAMNMISRMATAADQGIPMTECDLVWSFGVNDIYALVSDAQFRTDAIANVNAIRALGKINKIIGWTPPGFGMNGALSYGEVERRKFEDVYRSLEGTVFDYVLDTSVADPSLVPDGTSDKAVARHVTNHLHQTRQLIAAGSSPTGQCNDGLLGGHGADVIHGNELKHLIYADVFARDPYVGPRLGLVSRGGGSSRAGRFGRISRI